ncbi:hypothetical protein [Ruthenibacterium lactatiformans]|uniref:hypothetical protein n=1 Tax=Ruthenibacterium lactatiformans TaxID=1550024 RepID=UPI0039A260B7
MDTLGSAKRIYAPTIVLTDDPDPAIARLAAHVVKMPGGVDDSSRRCYTSRRSGSMRTEWGSCAAGPRR